MITSIPGLHIIQITINHLFIYSIFLRNTNNMHTAKRFKYRYFKSNYQSDIIIYFFPFDIRAESEL